MLTFEDFFQKKKIDLVQFKTAEPGLFAEFSRHYPLMGEKSFDHTKKYHFNYLRRTYPLPIIAKPHAVQAEDISAMAVQGIAVAAAQNLINAIEKPKFKEDHLVELAEHNVPENDISLAEAENSILKTVSETEVSKPAFEPRFNPKNIPKTETKLESEEQKPEIESVKPAFKPRFNMQNIKKDVVKTVPDETVLEAQDVPETTQSSTEQAEPVVKHAFKPRFNPKNIPKQVIELTSKVEVQNPEIAMEIIEPLPSLQPTENQLIKTVSESDSSISKLNPASPEPEKLVEKAVYKPRFQMKNIPKPPTDSE